MNNYNYVYYDNPLIEERAFDDNGYILFDPQEGFLRGNLFKNLYQPYKNYNVKTFNIQNAQDKKMYEIQMLSFAMHDLNLYLDTHPNNQSMIMLFQDYKRRKDKLCKEYEKEFSAITVGEGENDNQSFEWALSKWPWEVNNV